MTNVADSFPKEIKVGEFTVYKLKLSEYALVFERLQKLPVLLSEFTDTTNAALLAALPRLVATALPEVIDILAIATRTDREKLDETMDAKTAVQCLKAVFSVNDFFGLWEEIQTAIPSAQKAKLSSLKKT